MRAPVAVAQFACACRSASTIPAKITLPIRPPEPGAIATKQGKSDGQAGALCDAGCAFGVLKENGIMPYILAVDPGTEQSAFVMWDGDKVLEKGILPNDELHKKIWHLDASGNQPLLAIEWIESFGMAVGKEVFETVFWIGRFWECYTANGGECRKVTRREVKLHHCQSARAKDANIRQALIDKHGAPGTKKSPGKTFGISSHLWSAFAIATYVTETQ